ncbi:hypothetical protein Dimus_000421 [Dionaea muscipula]
MAMQKEEHLILRGVMRARTDMVTAIATPIDNSDMIVSASRDKSIILWNLTKEDKFALSGSWHGELRLWDLAAGTTARRFVGHTKDVFSVAFSIDNRQIVSASRDRTIRLWNTLDNENGICRSTIYFVLTIFAYVHVGSQVVKYVGTGECKFTVEDNDAHTDWVWNLINCKLRSTLAGHAGYVNIVVCFPDGSLHDSGGKDGVILVVGSLRREEVVFSWTPLLFFIPFALSQQCIGFVSLPSMALRFGI